MKAYINGIGMISPQHTAEGSDFLSEVVEYHLDFLRCIDPNYKAFIDPIASRRMSRLLKMGITSARLCLLDAGVAMPDAILTGTGLGSVEDTEKILHGLLQGEQLLNPTPFIQSTYNTISSQIAINLKCTHYNSTYVHRSFSFESGLQDAMMLLEENTATNALAGGIDEMTLNHLSIIRRLGKWKMAPESNLELLRYQSPGALAGEGSGYFLLSSERNEKSYAQLSKVETFYKPGGNEAVENRIKAYVQSLGLQLSDIDIFLTGISGDKESDLLYTHLAEKLFPGKPLAYYKHLCGDYLTASAFGLWVAANVLKSQTCPDILLVNGVKPGNLRNILLYNHLNGINHSMMLVSVAG